jgi:hypothetical protein
LFWIHSVQFGSVFVWKKKKTWILFELILFIIFWNEILELIIPRGELFFEEIN